MMSDVAKSLMRVAQRVVAERDEAEARAEKAEARALAERELLLEAEAEVARLRLALSRERESAVRNKAEVERLTAEVERLRISADATRGKFGATYMHRVAELEAEVERLRAQAVPEWAASAPLDEVRAWLDGRGRRSVAHYLDVGWEANLWGDRGTRIARARAETEEAALRALAAQVAGGEGDA